MRILQSQWIWGIDIPIYLRWLSVSICYSSTFKSVMVWTMNPIATLPLEYKKSARHSFPVDGSNRTSSLTHARYTPILDTDWFWHLQKPSYDEENGPNVSGMFSYAKGCLHLSSLCIAVYVKSCPEKQYGSWQCWGRRVAEMGIESACHTELCDIT